MIEVSRDVPAAPGEVFAVLADGWSYAGWVVGNSHIRDVDPGWPARGTRIHHSAGAWPMQIQDVTEVHAVEPGRLLELHARLRLLGNAVIRFTLSPLPDGAGTRVVMAEQAVSGAGGLIPAAVQALLLRPRNVESLARLSDMAAGRARLAATPRPGDQR
ncbi:MAG TPA: SRPBCC family protein [Pseudonocardiaceae bacterium]